MNPVLRKWLPWIAVAAVAIIAVVVIAVNSSDDGDDVAGGDTTTTTVADTTTTVADTTTTVADTTTTVADTTTTTVAAIGEVTVAVENLYPPFNFIDGTTNEGAGFDYDIWREICSRIGCEAVFVEAVWPDVILETGQGVYDTAADGISITEERKETVAFSIPYLNTIQRIMVRVDEDRWANADEFFLSNSRLGTQIGTTNYELATTLTDEGLIDAYESFPVAVLALLSGDVDAVIIDDVAGAGYVGEGNEGTKLLDGNLQSDPLGFIYAHGSSLIGPVDEALAAMDADGTLAALIDMWFINTDA